MSKKWVSIICLIFLMVTTAAWAKPDSAYIDNGNGTVTDIETKLMWQQGRDGTMSWYDATSYYCPGLSLAGYNDWRLPTLDELKTLVDKSWGFNPTINRTFFPGTVSSYWSSTTHAPYTNYAWGVDFSDGHDDIDYKGSCYYVRAVRGGQSGSLDNWVISPLDYLVTKDAGSTTFSVSNTGAGIIPWKAAVTAGADWLSISSGAGGTNTGTITCAYTATSTSSRTGTIRVTAYGADGTSIQKDVAVIQQNTLSASPNGSNCESNYVDNGDGTVTDINTGLMWQQQTGDIMSWNDAMLYCTEPLANYSDWRLPTKDELKTLTSNCWTPTIDPAYFPNTFPDFYWSSTYDTDSGPAWGVHFGIGQEDARFRYDGGYVRAVR